MSMNRKQRRLQEKKSGTKTTKKTRDNAALALEKKAQGNALKAAGKEADAVPLLKEALRLDPTQADVHFALAMMARTSPELGLDMEEVNKTLPKASKENLLGSYSAILVILKKKRQYKEAHICQEEFCRLLPDDPMALMDLGLIQNLTGGTEKAVVDMASAVCMAPDNKVIKSVFATSLFTPSFSKFYPEVKNALLECFKSIYDVNLFRIAGSWLGLMFKDPLYSELFKTQMMKSDEEFYSWMDALDEQSGAFLKDPYFTEGLRVLIIAYLGMEEILTKIRRYITLNFDELTQNGRIELFEHFICALAEQCFFNEYVYNEEEQETKEILALINKAKNSPDKTAVSLIACYHPLNQTFKAQERQLHEFSKTDVYFAKLVKTQFDDPAEEERLKQSIPVYGAFANEISKAVQSQYEENPYPRWTTLCTQPMPTDDCPDNETRNDELNILIAGCGTGRQPISAAARHPNAKVTAIDLSRASIAYGMRKAKECGLDDRIKFIHADILSMADWEEQFDMIECSGVLHHMEDPFEGWKALNNILKPGGYFKIGLYSATARQQIVEARTFIQKYDFPSTTEGIRACRKAVFELPSNDPMRIYLLGSGDFYATSLVRDLIFHVQEHRMTLPQIKGMMDELGLVSTKFSMSNPDQVAQYDKMFPGDLKRCNIENWAIFEEQNPLTFISMYQFWCQKMT